MYVELIPEAIGLILTPAAIAGCILLLQSRHPYGNAGAFAAAFLVLYTAIGIMVLAVGDTVEPTAETEKVKGIASLTVGVLFLLVGVVISLHHKQTREGPPKWAALLESARPTGAFIAGMVLALANPNVFLLLSGLAIVLAEADGRADQVGGAVMLLTAVAIDFVVPVVVFALFGTRARLALDTARRWMIAHDRLLGLIVLYGFGALFAIRGLNGIV